MLIDTHCHIYLEQFDEDLQEVLDRAGEAGVGHICMPAISVDSLPKMDKMSHSNIDFHKMAGIHPTTVNEGVFITEQDLYEICSDDDMVAVGETGLDYYWSSDYKQEQKKSLRLHCRVAKALDKPVILHNRESTVDLLSIIEEEQDGSLRGIWHCFNGTQEEGRKAIDMGLHLGIGGVLTFKNAGVDATVGRLPLDRMVVETDAPYLAPAPNRGERNEPAFIRLTAERLSEVMEEPIDLIEEKTTANAVTLFGLEA